MLAARPRPSRKSAKTSPTRRSIRRIERELRAAVGAGAAVVTAAVAAGVPGGGRDGRDRWRGRDGGRDRARRSRPGRRSRRVRRLGVAGATAAAPGRPATVAGATARRRRALAFASSDGGVHAAARRGGRRASARRVRKPTSPGVRDIRPAAAATSAHRVAVGERRRPAPRSGALRCSSVGRLDDGCDDAGVHPQQRDLHGDDAAERDPEQPDPRAASAGGGPAARWSGSARRRRAGRGEPPRWRGGAGRGDGARPGQRPVTGSGMATAAAATAPAGMRVAAGRRRGRSGSTGAWRDGCSSRRRRRGRAWRRGGRAGRAGRRPAAAGPETRRGATGRLAPEAAVRERLTWPPCRVACGRRASGRTAARGLSATSPGVGTMPPRAIRSASGSWPQTQTGRSGGQMQPGRGRRGSA